MDHSNGTVTGMRDGYGFQSISQLISHNGSDILGSMSVPSKSIGYLDNIPFDDPNRTPDSNSVAQSDNKSCEDLLGFAEISDIPLDFISKILLEEDMEDQVYIHPGELLAAEKPFFEILHEQSPSPDQPPLHSDCSLESPDSGSSGQFHNSQDEAAAFVADLLVDNGWHDEFGEHPASEAHTVGIVDYLSASVPNGVTGREVAVCELEEYLLHSTLPVLDEGRYIGQFNKGVDEARKFLPDTSKLSINIEFDGILPPEISDEEIMETKVKVEGEEEPAGHDESRGKRNQNLEDLDSEEGRSKKQIAVAPERTIRSELLDSMLLCSDEPICELKVSTSTNLTSQTEGIDNAKNGPTKKGPNTGRSKGKKQASNKVIDLRSLMIQCAQSVAVDDRRSANEQLKQIRQHSSPVGDASQRLAHYFANGLEARLAGTGSQIYRTLRAKKTTSADILKACRLYMGSCPFKILSFFLANQTMLKMSQNVSRVHIIDYGIGFGFQWPCLIQRFSMREEGPPKLRITGIDFPQPGFRPTERLEETGVRLSDYADSFGVPFEYHPVASSNWEKIKAEDLHIEEDELLFVNALFQFRNLADETVDVECPRNMVLNNIKKMNPAAFLLGIYSGAYGAPFFMTRFREAFFHFSALFDMLDCITTRDNPERELVERELFGLEAMNVIACEGSERVHRPETHKQWTVRNQRAGFSQLPPDPAFVKFAKLKANTGSNKDFIVDEDNKWLLIGWKGRVTHAVSKWKPSGFAV